ncbi:hypothetical protein ACLKMH_01735 [Psychromonas sp. KJ10-10]|uniref:hypothetical protein n=1 Tax=Psychromonas sp. KJ10-10 TaxID=3391823 RepID=UPI0039B63941
MKREQYPKRFPVTMMEGDKPKVVGEEKTQNTAKYDVYPLLTVEDIIVRFDINKRFLKG